MQYVYICMYACMYVCVHVCMYVCMYVCVSLSSRYIRSINIPHEKHFIAKTPNNNSNSNSNSMNSLIKNSPLQRLFDKKGYGNVWIYRLWNKQRCCYYSLWQCMQSFTIPNKHTCCQFHTPPLSFSVYLFIYLSLYLSLNQNIKNQHKNSSLLLQYQTNNTYGHFHAFTHTLSPFRTLSLHLSLSICLSLHQNIKNQHKNTPRIWKCLVP